VWTPGVRYATIAGAILLLAVGYIAGYSLGWAFSRQLIRQLQSDKTKESDQIDSLNSELVDQKTVNQHLTDELKKAQESLGAIFQPTRRLALNANKAERVSVGRSQSD